MDKNEDQEIDCPDCEGTGTTVDHIVLSISHEIALDLGDLKLEGSDMRLYYDKSCPRCEGCGKIKNAKEPEANKILTAP